MSFSPKMKSKTYFSIQKRSITLIFVLIINFFASFRKKKYEKNISFHLKIKGENFFGLLFDNEIEPKRNTERKKNYTNAHISCVEYSTFTFIHFAKSANVRALHKL
jgi:hypothetical protein